MATPSSLGRSLLFPPEILLHILAFVSESYGSDYTHLNQRNADLAQLALVSREFQAAAYSVLYGDLRLTWTADKVGKLRKSFSENPQLLPLVRRLQAIALHHSHWLEDNRDAVSAHCLEEWVNLYCAREGIKQHSDDWIYISRRQFENDAIEDEFIDFWETRARENWDDAGYGTWDGEGDREGALELLDVVSLAPALRSIVIEGFQDELPPSDLATRGPYPHIQTLISLDSTKEEESLNSSPFIADHTLPSLLASRTPNLRSLTGAMPWDETLTTPNPLPPSLTRLNIRGHEHAYEDPRVDPLLQALPSLRSLTVVHNYIGWEHPTSAALVGLLSSLETLSVFGHSTSDGPGGEIESSLACAIALSPSLRHLALVPTTASLITSLPPTIQSITFSPSSEHPQPRMERVLKLLLAAATPPLRVEFSFGTAPSNWWRGGKTATWEEGIVALEECRDDYAAEGHTLYIRRA